MAQHTVQELWQQTKARYDAGLRQGGGRGVGKKWENLKIFRSEILEAGRASLSMLNEQDVEMEERGLEHEVWDLDDWRTPMQQMAFGVPGRPTFSRS